MINRHYHYKDNGGWDFVRWRPTKMSFGPILSEPINNEWPVSANDRFALAFGTIVLKGLPPTLINTTDDDVIKWKHFTGPLCREFAGHQWISITKTSDAEFSLICAWINGWNNREAGDLKRHRAHYDVIVMCREMSPGLSITLAKSFWIFAQSAAVQNIFSVGHLRNRS